MPSPVRQRGMSSDKHRKVHISEEMAAIARGEVDLTEWTDEQLEAARLKMKGHAPILIPSALFFEWQRRQREKAQEELTEILGVTGPVLLAMITGEEVDDKARIAAIKLVQDRVMGKEPIVVQAQVESRIEQVARGAVKVDRDGFGGDDDSSDRFD